MHDQHRRLVANYFSGKARKHGCYFISIETNPVIKTGLSEHS